MVGNTGGKKTLAGFALMALIAAFQLYQDVQAVRGIAVFPWAETEEGIDI